ncbi:hypothetical protein GCM10023322_77390 [Rugosimonospora acidiphila]|uniref:Uncharacterized protein n=1 Tax=Rugosimonospora acidiphila TaxID=556531 RepID=A0ABP9SRL9_9ACTN
MASWRELGGPARGIGTAIGRAVAAAGDRDREVYEAEAAELVALPPEYAGLVLGALVRMLLEEQHPDGLDSDDIQAVLARCYRGAAGWLPVDRLDAATLVAALASALGIHEPGVTYREVMGPPAGTRAGDDWPGDDRAGGHVYGGGATETVPVRVPTAAEYAWHAPLLIADLLTAGGRRLDRYLDVAFTEIARAETMELP